MYGQADSFYKQNPGSMELLGDTTRHVAKQRTNQPVRRGLVVLCLKDRPNMRVAGRLVLPDVADAQDARRTSARGNMNSEW